MRHGRRRNGLLSLRHVHGLRLLLLLLVLLLLLLLLPLLPLLPLRAPCIMGLRPREGSVGSVSV